MFKDSALEKQGSSTLHGLFATALHTLGHDADKTEACRFDDGYTKVTATYTEVKTMVGRVRKVLVTAGVSQEPVGVCIKPQLCLPAVLLGIMSVPASYCPLDISATSYFTHTVRSLGITCIIVDDFHLQLLQNSGGVYEVSHTKDIKVASCSLLLVHLSSTLMHTVPTKRPHMNKLLAESDMKNEVSTNGQTVNHCLTTKDTSAGSVLESDSECDGSNQSNQWDENTVAYCITTSGTTGRPKVIKVPHSCIVPNIIDFRKLFGVTNNDLILLTSPLTFDPSVIEIFLSLSCGAALLVVPDVVKVIPQKLVAMTTQRNRVTILQATPSLMYSIKPDVISTTLLRADSSLRVLALGGEPCPTVSTLASWRGADNRTRIYNLYGTTEVSCWATYTEIQTHDVTSDQIAVPLGKPLSDTSIEVRNSQGQPVDVGEGEIFIGGRRRACHIDADTRPHLGDGMRRTGDIGRVTEDGRVYCEGRVDQVYKRHGMRLCLVALEQTVTSVEGVTHAACVCQDDRLIVFVCLRDIGDPKVVEIEAEIERCLPRQYRPDDVVCMPALPTTKHGKVDRGELAKIYTDRTNMIGRLGASESVAEIVGRKWREVLRLDIDDVIGDGDNFVLHGGDSLRAVRLASLVESTTGVALPEILDRVLNGCYSGVLRYVCDTIESSRDNLKEVCGRVAGETHEDHGGSNVENDKIVEINEGMLSSEGMLEKDTNEFTFVGSVSRGNRTSECVWSAHRKRKNYGKDQASVIREVWKYDTGKCVDASPLLVLASTLDESLVIIGSHSHKCVALRPLTGELVWMTTLGGPVESSAGLSVCGRFIIVGCYDHCVYIICARDGSLHWVFTTGAEVKSSPTVNTRTALVYIGSHDRHVYALDIENKLCVWSTDMHAGSVFSSPHLSLQPYHLYAATLTGVVGALDPDTGAILWEYNTQKPVFASAASCAAWLVVGCVDGFLYCISHSGYLLWKHDVSGPIFSSPVITASQTCRDILVGSHGNSVICITENNQRVWEFSADSSVYATPFVVEHDVQHVASDVTLNCKRRKISGNIPPTTTRSERKVPEGQDRNDKTTTIKKDDAETSNIIDCKISDRDIIDKSNSDINFGDNPTESNSSSRNLHVIFSSVRGTLYIVDCNSGDLTSSHRLHRDVFSSPVCYRGYMWIGCRDDNLYCYQYNSNN